MGTISIGHHSLITGGTFTQVNHTHNVQHSQFDRLQAAVAPAAFHNSAERFDPPKCHPNTRVAVMDELIDWVIRTGPFGHKKMLWLSGPAGAGKSAIAQSLAEICFPQRFLLATFFFNRSDPSRNNPKHLVATLAYQIYRVIPQHYQDQILEVIRGDPLIFDRSVEAQLKALILDPLEDLFRVKFFNNHGAPRLILLDGLDECSTGAVQVNLLAALQAMLAKANNPFIILVASRPEHDIQMYFRSSRLETPIHRLDLDDSYAPDDDILLFVKDKLAELRQNHPLKGRIPQTWPSDEDVQTIVWKSSGQFIYASVVIKYVTSSRHYPPDRLDVVCRLRPAKRHLPFAELDALYSHNFSLVEDITLVLQIIQVIMLFDGIRGQPLSAQHIEALCDMEQGGCFSALCDLQSVLHLPESPLGSISFLHKSLPDFLQDPVRSLDYHIDATSQAGMPIVSRCFQLISELKYEDLYGRFIMKHRTVLISNTQQFHEDILSFSLMDQWNVVGTDSNLLSFALHFVDHLYTLQGTDNEYLYFHHLRELQTFAFRYPEIFKDRGELSIWRSGMIVVLILSEKSTSSVSPGVLEFLHAVESPPADTYNSYVGIKNLVTAAAHHCINTLVPDSTPELISFALKWLPNLLRSSALLPALYDACLPERIQIPSVLVSEVQKPMAYYRERYEWELEGTQPLTGIRSIMDRQ